MVDASVALLAGQPWLKLLAGEAELAVHLGEGAPGGVFARAVCFSWAGTA